MKTLSLAGFVNVGIVFIMVILSVQEGYGLPRVPQAEKIVELAVFIDEYLYDYWFTMLKSSGASAANAGVQNLIRSYLSALIQNLNLIYAHPSLSSPGSSIRRSSSEKHAGIFIPLIGFHLSHTQLFWRRDSNNLHPDLQETAPNYLNSFCEFARNENWNKADGGSRWDHALLLTGVDLKFANGTNYGVAGISWDNSMCNKTYSCSVVEGKTFRSIMTTAHEIGHSLGIEHDGIKYNFKCAPRGYIMSYNGAHDEDTTGKIAWSPCSKYNLRAFLNTAPNVLSNQVQCLDNLPRGHWNEREGRMKNNEEMISLPVIPAEIFTLEEQCMMGGGKHWIPSKRRRHIKKVCSMIYCNDTIARKIIPFHPALEGTSCGNGKICRFGECKPILDDLIMKKNPSQKVTHTMRQLTSNVFSYLSNLMKTAKKNLLG